MPTTTTITPGKAGQGFELPDRNSGLLLHCFHGYVVRDPGGAAAAFLAGGPAGEHARRRGGAKERAVLAHDGEGHYFVVVDAAVEPVEFRKEAEPAPAKPREEVVARALRKLSRAEREALGLA